MLHRPKTLKELLAYSPPAYKPLISDDILGAGQRLILFGKYETFKSMMAHQLLFCIASGKNWLGFHTTPTAGLYISLEGTELDLKKRISQYAEEHHLYPSNIHFYYSPELLLDSMNGIALLDAMLSQTKAKLLILDPYYKVVRSEVDEISVNSFIRQIDSLLQKHGLALILVAHDSKGLYEAGQRIDRGADDMRGLNTPVRWADTVIHFYEVDRDKDIIRLEFQKQKVAKERQRPIKLWFNRKTLELQRC